MIFFSLIAPKVRHVQTIDKKYTHGQYNQFYFWMKGFARYLLEKNKRDTPFSY